MSLPRLVAVTRADISVQWRSHFYTATALTALVLCAVALISPLQPLPAKFAAMLIFLDPAVVGVTFVGGQVMMEKGAKTLAALKVTPMPGSVYVGAKVITLTLLGTLCGLAVAACATRGVYNPALLIMTLILSNAAAVLIGFALIARARSVNGFLANIIFASLVLILPALGFFGLVPAVVDAVLLLIPSYAMLTLLEASVQTFPLAMTSVAWPATYLGLWLVGGWVWALREYDLQLAKEGL